ncbi:MAG: Gx transporter family protein [Lachnospiraceae bacterium]|nr:Gx transporter family protein [Lachnospiraceae bacterium]
MNGKRLAFLGIFLGLAMILSYVETLLPVFPFAPGMKIGLANLVTVFLLFRFRAAEAFLISLVRVILSALLFGTLFSFLFSLSGFLVSFFGMLILKKTKAFRPVSVSVTGGVLHNLAQIVLAMILLGSREVLYYLPVLFLTGIVSGALIGVLAAILIQKLPVLHE